MVNLTQVLVWEHFTCASVEKVNLSTHDMDVPINRCTTFEVMFGTADELLIFLWEDGEKNDVKCPERGVATKIKILLDEDKVVIVTVMAARGRKITIESKAGLED